MSKLNKLWDAAQQLNLPDPEVDKVDFEEADRFLEETKRKLDQCKNITEKDLALFVGY